MRLSAQERDLYQKLLEFPLDDPESELPFSDRLARENGWSIGYSLRVVDEYKRFVLLALVADHVVCPSEQVDQAWHMHLTYTESYWSDMCQNTLGRPLHHGPTKGGPAEGVKYRDLYERTQATYRHYFQENPPSDIWPDTETRFGEDLSFRRVNTQHFWLVPKPRHLLRRMLAGRSQELVVLGLMPLAFAAVNPFELRGPQFLLLFGIVYLFSVVAALVLRQTLRRESGERVDFSGADVKDPYEVAYLAGGEARVAQTATATLVRSGVLSVEKGLTSTRLIDNSPPPEHAHEVETAVYAAVQATGGKVEGHRFKKFGTAAFAKLKRSLVKKGLVETGPSFMMARLWPLAVLCPVLLLGLIKLMVGISREKPVGFLFIGIAMVVATMCWLAISQPRCTIAGQRLLQQLKRANNDGQEVMEIHGADGLNNDLAFSVALLGVAVALSPKDPISQLFAAPEWNASGSSSSSTGCAATGCGGGGCGGGGCGGGCGGCGG